MEPEILALMCAFGFSISMIPLSPRIYIALACICAMLPLTSFVPSNVFVSGFVRSLSCYWLAIALIRQDLVTKGLIVIGKGVDDYYAKIKRFSMIFVAYFVLIVIVFLAHPMDLATLAERIAGIGIGMLTMTLLLGCAYLLIQPLSWALTAGISLSLLAGFLTPDVAIVHGRLAGIFVNANTTGFLGACLIATVALRRKLSTWSCLQVLLAYSAVAWSASRTSAAVATFMLLALLFGRMRWSLRISALLIGVGGAYFLLPVIQAAIADHLLFRDVASRTQWGWALDVYRSSPLFGAGEILTPTGDEVATGVGSSVLTLAVFGGSVGLAFFAVTTLILAVNAWRSGYGTAIVSIGFLAHSVFESWLAAPGSPMMLIVFFVLVTAMQLDAQGVTELAFKGDAHLSRARNVYPDQPVHRGIDARASL